MTGSLLAAAIGWHLGNVDGLLGVHLPSALDPAVAHALAVSVDHRSGDEQRGIVVADNPGTHPPSLPAVAVTPRTAVRYRNGNGGNRVFVFCAQPLIGHSLVNAVTTVISPSFPATVEQPFDYAALARACLRACLVDAGRDAAVDRVNDDDVELLAGVLEALSHLHEQLGSTTIPWNVAWWRHVDTGLTVLSDALARARGDESLSALLNERVNAAFALPRPPSTGWAPAKHGKQLATAFKEWWSDSDIVASSLALLEQREGPESEPASGLLELDWTRLDDGIASQDNVALGFAGYESSDPKRLDGLAGLSFKYFCDPPGQDSDEPIIVESTDGTSLRNDQLDLPVIGRATTTLHDGRPVHESPPFRLRLAALATGPVPVGASLDVQCAPKSWTFVATSDVYLEDGGYCVDGHLRLPANARLDGRPRSFRVHVGAQSPLVGRVHPSTEARYVLLPPSDNGVLLYPLARSGKPSKPELVELGTGEAVRSVEVDAGKTHAMVVWASSGGIAVNGEAIDVAGEPGGVCSVILEQPDGTTIEVGDSTVELVGAGGREYLSPVVAAIHDRLPATGQLPGEVASSLLAVLERKLRAAAEAPGLLDPTHGHIALPCDRTVDLSNLEVHGHRLVPTATTSYWTDLAPVPADLVEGAEAIEFRAALAALDLPARLSRATADGQVPTLPSRTSWARLFDDERHLLENYLEAFQRLVAAARQLGDARGIFWATYPLSVSTWRQVGGIPKMQTVMLSPLHPVRLAWLASTEATLKAARSARSLAGIVEGWNFPLVGPGTSPAGRVVAMPIDNGHDQLFLGWSLLARAALDDPTAPTAPDRVGGLPAPGTSAAGLNAGGVTAAMTEYRRMSPHVTTLVVDLAATSDAPRLEEIDSAIMSAIDDWTTQGRESLRGGVRVLDSVHRTGAVPRTLVADGRRDDVPVTWTRYQRATDSPAPRANMRVLQGGGVLVAAEDHQSAESMGVAGAAPLRRFAVPAKAHATNGLTASHPGLTGANGWPAFQGAVEAMEAGSTPGTVTGLRTRLGPAIVQSGGAEWTVTGEALASPAAIAALLDQQDHESLLWEWRPPFLASRSDAALATLERRPYVAIVKVPPAFMDQLETACAKLAGAANAATLVQDVLRVLGSRGLGLSSLVSMGGTHVTGALGFYLALRVLEEARPPGVHRFVLPIDACDQFLAALAGSEHGRQRKRADLLVLEVTSDELVLMPVEVKLYDLNATSGTLDQPTGTRYAGAIEQAMSSNGHLQELCTTYEQVQADPDARPDAMLARTGLAALLEVAMRLAPFSSIDQPSARTSLSNVLAGTLRPTVRPPLVMYFQNGATGTDGATHRAGLEDGIPGKHGAYGDFTANAASIVTDLNGAGIAVASCRGLVQRLMNYRPREAEAEPRREVSLEAIEPAEPRPAASSEEDTLHAAGGSPPDERSTEPGEQAEAASQPDAEPLSEPAPDPEAGPIEPALGAVSEVSSAAQSDEAPGVKVEIGRFLDAVDDAPAHYWPGNTDLNQLNIGIVGDLGKGKTQFVKALIDGLRREVAATQVTPISVLVFDYKRDFQDAEFLEAVGGRVLEPHRIPLDVLGVAPDARRHERFQRAQSFVDVLEKIYAGIGPKQRSNVRSIAMKLYEETSSPSLDDLLAAYEQDIGIDSVVSTLQEFVYSEMFETDPSKIAPFDELMDDTVLVVDLASLGANDHAKNALVVLMLNQYFEYMQRLEKWPYGSHQGVQTRTLNSFLVVDEAVNIMAYEFPVLERLLRQGREFGVGVVLSSQYHGDFKQSHTNYGEALKTWMIHGVPHTTRKQLEAIGLPAASDGDAARIADLATHEGYYVSLKSPGRFVRGHPFFETR